MSSQRPFLLLRISFPGRPIFIQFIPGVDGRLGVVPVGVGVGPTVAPGVVLGVTLAVQSDPVVRLTD